MERARLRRRRGGRYLAYVARAPHAFQTTALRSGSRGERKQQQLPELHRRARARGREEVVAEEIAGLPRARRGNPLLLRGESPAPAPRQGPPSLAPYSRGGRDLLPPSEPYFPCRQSREEAAREPRSPAEGGGSIEL
nr:unnamed protein product [Digitaria exilis]